MDVLTKSDKERTDEKTQIGIKRDTHTDGRTDMWTDGQMNRWMERKIDK